MVDTALLWVALTATFGLFCLAGALKRYADTTRLDYWGVAGTSVAAGGVGELLVANGHVVDSTASNLLRLLFLSLGGVFVVVALRTQGIGRRPSSSTR